MDRFWLVTSHTYGTWLPGSERGFVGETRDDMCRKIIHNQPGTPCDTDVPGPRRFAQQHMKSPPIYLSKVHADRLFDQFNETCRCRGWTLLGVSIAPTHFHSRTAGRLDHLVP